MTDDTKAKKTSIEGDLNKTAKELKDIFSHSSWVIDRALLRLKVEIFASLDWDSDCHAAVRELGAQYGDHSKDHYILACDDCQREEKTQ